MKKRKKWLAVLIIFAGCAIAAFLAVSEEDEKRLSHVPTPALSVDIFAAQLTQYRVQVPAWGFVEPSESIPIRTEISGKVVHVADQIITGATVKRGAHMFSLDPRSYRNALMEARAKLDQALQALTIEKGHQTIAKSEWKLLEQSQWRGEQNQTLALRVPQFKAREAAVQIASARQAQAALDLERTKVKAPCHGIILQEDLAAGQVLDRGQTVMKLACTECYHLMACFNPKYLLSDDIRSVSINVGPNRYTGTIKTVLPQITPDTRQKQALVEFKGENIDLGDYVSLILPGQLFKDVFVLPQEGLRPGPTVWVVTEAGTLEIREISVLAQDLENVVIGNGLTQGDRVVLSHIATPLRGMPLRIINIDGKDSQSSVHGKEING